MTFKPTGSPTSYPSGDSGTGYLANYPIGSHSWNEYHGDFDINITIASMAVVVAIVLHSFYLHNLRLNRVRILLYICCALVLGSGMSWVECKYSLFKYCNKQDVVFGLQVVSNALFCGIFQLIDCYFAYYRYEVLWPDEIVPIYHKIISAAYVFIFSWCSWVLPLTIVPAFADISHSDDGEPISIYNSYLDYTYGYTTIFYHIIYTCLIIWRLSQLYL